MVRALVNPRSALWTPMHPVADGVLVVSIGNIHHKPHVQCADGTYFGSLRAPSNVYDETFPLLGTTSLAAGDAADKCLSASPNYSPAALLRYNALHSLYFV